MKLLKIRSITQLKEITLHGRKRKLLTYVLLGSRLVFGEPKLDLVNSKNSQSGVIFRTLNQESSMTTNFNQESGTQPELILEDGPIHINIPSGEIMLDLPRGGGEWHPKSGPGPRAKADARKAGINRTANSKAKNLQSDGSSFAKAFTTNHPTQSRPGQNKDGLFSRFPSQARPNPYNPGCSKAPRSVKVTSANRNNPEQGRRSTSLQAYGPSHTQASTFTNTDGSVNLDLGYQEVLRRARFSTDFECSFDRFSELASEDGESTIDTMRTAISALQLEADGVVSNVRRDPVAEANRVKAFDFLADGPNGETHLEIKGPVGSEIRKLAGLGPSIPKQGKKTGFKIRNQRNYWFNPNTDKSGVTQPESRNKVLVVNDLFDVPSAEKAQMESSINFGLKGEHPILFINNQMNR